MSSSRLACSTLAERDGPGIRAELPPGHIHSFRDRRVPALWRVNAVTPRTRELYTGDIVIPETAH